MSQSLRVARGSAQKLRGYAQMHRLSSAWKTLLDTDLVTSRAFGAQRAMLHQRDGSLYLRHTPTIYLIDRSMQVRAAFDEEDSAEEMSQRLMKELQAPTVLPPAVRQHHLEEIAAISGNPRPSALSAFSFPPAAIFRAIVENDFRFRVSRTSSGPKARQTIAQRGGGGD